MRESRDVELNNRIGQALLGILPSDAESITAKAIIQDDWSEVGFEFTRASGDIGHFSHEMNPDDTADQIADSLAELRTFMAGQGHPAWNRSDFTVRRDGQFDVAFSYEADPEL